MSVVKLCRALAVLILGLSAPLAAQTEAPPEAAETQADDAPVREISADETDADDDARIARRIRSILAELDGYDDIGVSVRSGIVTLDGEIVDVTRLDRLETLAAAVEGVVAVENEVVETTDLSRRLSPAVDRMQDRLVQTIALLPLLAVALVIAVLIAVAGFLLARRDQPWDRLAPNAFIADIYRQIVRLLFVLGGLVVALDILNATALLGTILGAAGIIGLAIGFAVKDTVENFIASIMLSIRQPFRPNDMVEINGDEGKVVRLTSRATILLSLDGNHIRIPNATVFKSRILNYTRNPKRRYDFGISVEPESDLAAVRTLMEETIASLPFTLDVPGINVWLEEVDERGATFTVTGWIDQRETSHLRARGEALRLVKNAVEAGGYAIPDTTYRIRLDGGGGMTVREEDADAAPAPPSRPPAKADPKDVAPDVEAKEDEAVEQMIDAERADTRNSDLLRYDAREE